MRRRNTRKKLLDAGLFLLVLAGSWHSVASTESEGSLLNSMKQTLDDAKAVVTALVSDPKPRTYSQEREPCLDYQENRQPFFGDFHVHTKYSLDASTQGTITTPDQAYRFAKGERIGIQPWRDGQPMRSLQLKRPLDFAMVSDHAELFGEVYICNTPEAEGYGSWQCMLYRNWKRGAYYLFNATASVKQGRLGFCGDDGELCRQAGGLPWQEMQEAAYAHNDSSSACEFTTFIGYEWTGATSDMGGNLHRNVVFRNHVVPGLPISWIDGSPEYLWNALDRQCNESGSGCEALTIPHNSNLSGGAMFVPANDNAEPLSPAEATLRQKYEPLVEIMQHKGDSECYFEAGVTKDELCAFEKLPNRTFASNKPAQPGDGFLRDVLKDGLLEQQRNGVNPFQFGFVGSSDTHLGAPGAVEEDVFLGHGGAGVPARKKIPPGLPDTLSYNPGGLAVLWAEENSRDALFDAMQRREAYGTSGPRIVTRFFGGWDYKDNMCSKASMVERAYRGGVAMGGELQAPEAGQSPKFVLSATKDPGTADSAGMPLQRIQLVKGWIDGQGNKQEKVYDVAGDANNGASVNTQPCEVSGEGFANLCTVWEDPDFNPDQPAYYYSRVLENPSCRWSQQMCVANQVDCSDPSTIGEGLEGCCAADHRPIIQERAWSSPIWYTPSS